MRKVFIFLMSLLFGFQVATQYVAHSLNFINVNQVSNLTLFKLKIYFPWQFLIWDFAYGNEMKPEFFMGWGIILIFLLLGIIIVLFISRGDADKQLTSTTHGSATWGDSKTVEKADLLKEEGVILGMDQKGRYLRHSGPEHIKVIAPTRSGKGVGIVIPTLFAWDSSVIVYDLKSENWNITSGYRANFSNVLYFNPADTKSCHFNPLLEVRKGELEVRDVQNIADMIVDPDGHGMGDHWAKTGHSLLVGTILHVLYAEEDKTLSGVADFLSNPEMTLESTLQFMLHATHLEDGRTHPVVAATARDMLNKAENERSGVLSTAMSFLSLYRDPIVAKNTSDCDFRIVDLVSSEKPLSLYIAIPPSDVDRLRRLTRLIINQICRRLTEELPTEINKHKLLLLLDEFPALGRLNFFETALGFLAGYGIKAMLISQSINQIEKAYGTKNSIIDNAHIKVMFTPNTVQTAELISKMLGQKTQSHQQRNFSKGWLSFFPSHTVISNQEVGRQLLTTDEVMKFPKDEAMLFVAGEAPIKARKIKYYEDTNFINRALPAPKLNSSGPYPYRPKVKISEWHSEPQFRKKVLRKKSFLKSQKTFKTNEPEVAI